MHVIKCFFRTDMAGSFSREHASMRKSGQRNDASLLFQWHMHPKTFKTTKPALRSYLPTSATLVISLICFFTAFTLSAIADGSTKKKDIKSTLYYLGFLSFIRHVLITCVLKGAAITYHAYCKLLLLQSR